MKKKFLAMALCLATVLSFSACGNEKDNTESTQAEESVNKVSSADIEIDPEKVVKELADYKNIQVTIGGDYDVTDEDVAEQIETVLANFGIQFEKVTDRDVVQAGDFVGIEYVGLDQNGEAFEGGSTTSEVVMDIDNNLDATHNMPYVANFCDNLFGAKVGETVDQPLTFPENYGNAELAGQDVTFQITVNAIYKKVSVDTLTDEFVSENFSKYELKTVQELKDYMREYLTFTATNSKLSDTLDVCEQYLLDNSKVEVPEEYLEARLNEYIDKFEKQYITGTETMDSYFESGGYSKDEVIGQWKTSLEEQIRLEQIFLLIAKKENVEMDPDEYQEFIEGQITANQEYNTEDDIYEEFGNGNKEGGKAYVENLFRIRKAMTLVAESAVVTIENGNTSEGSESVEEGTEATE